jgi:hypothetical protein
MIPRRKNGAFARRMLSHPINRFNPLNHYLTLSHPVNPIHETESKVSWFNGILQQIQGHRGFIDDAAWGYGWYSKTLPSP